MDPRKMEDYETGRQHWKKIFDDAFHSGISHTALVSLGDLGESKAVYPDTSELFAGTSECHYMTAEYLRSLHPNYEVVGGNHGT